MDFVICEYEDSRVIYYPLLLLYHIYLKFFFLFLYLNEIENVIIKLNVYQENNLENRLTSECYNWHSVKYSIGVLADSWTSIVFIVTTKWTFNSGANWPVLW